MFILMEVRKSRYLTSSLSCLGLKWLKLPYTSNSWLIQTRSRIRLDSPVMIINVGTEIILHQRCGTILVTICGICEFPA